MDIITQRAFSRNHLKSPILFAHCNCNGDEYCEADMRNSSVGGMYFESRSAVRPGSNIHIKVIDYSPDPYWPEADDNFFAEVRWCVRKGKARSPLYGIGVRFINDSCRQCGEKIRYYDSYGPQCVDLCQECRTCLDRIGNEKVKHCFENYLLGNVI